MAAYHAVIWWWMAVLITTAAATATAATTYPFTTATAPARTACTLALEHSRVAGSSELAFEANCTGETLVVALGEGVVMPRQSPGVKVVDQDACTLDDGSWTGCAVTLCAGTSAEFHSSTIMLDATAVDRLLNATNNLPSRFLPSKEPFASNYGMIGGQYITVALYGMKLSINHQMTTQLQYERFENVAGIVLLSSNITLVKSYISGDIYADICNVTMVDSNLRGDYGLSSHSSNVSVVDSNISGEIRLIPLSVDAIGFDYACILTMVGNSVSTIVTVEGCNVTMVKNSVSGYVTLIGAAGMNVCNATLDGNNVSGDIVALGCNVTMLNDSVSGNITLRECNANMVNTNAGIISLVFETTSLAPAALINLSACTMSKASANLEAIHHGGPLYGTDYRYYMNSLCENPDPRACYTLPHRVALICAGANQKFTSYHFSPDTCIDSRWVVNVVLVYVLFGVVVMSILACAVILRKVRRSHNSPQTGRRSGDRAFVNFIWAFVKGIGARISSNMHPLVAHSMQMLVPILRIALMVWDFVTDTVVMYKIFQWSGGVDEWIASRRPGARSPGMPVKVGASDAIVGSYVVLYFVPYILSSLILHIRVAALVAGLKDAAVQAYPSLLPYELHATLNPWLWIFMWWYSFILWLLWCTLMDIPMMVLHTVSAGHLFAWLQLTNYFSLHSFLAAVIRAPYSAGLVTYVYVTGISAEQPIEVSSTLFWFGVGSSLLQILYWVGRFVLTAIAGWPDTSVHTLMKDMFVNLVKHDKVPTFTASMPA